MFKKLVSHLKFSPSLIGELAQLSNRLRVQNPVRIASVVALGLLLVIQIILYTNPPVGSNPTYAGSMFFDSSIQTNDITNQLDNNYKALNDIFSTVGISQDNIKQTSIVDTPEAESNIYRLSRWPIDHSSESITYNTGMDVYLTPVNNWGQIVENERPFISGQNTDSINFFISSSTGSMYLNNKPTRVNVNSPVKLTTEYINASTQTNNAEPLKSSDRIKVTLKATNTSSEPQEHTFKLSLGDALEYLNIETDTASTEGPSLSDISKELSWSPTILEPQSSATREVNLKVKSSPSNLPQNSAHPYSQDCVITLVHGNQIDIPVECSLQKELEMFTSTLPSISGGKLLIANIVLFFVALVLLAKALQEEEEIRIIRHKFNSGA